MKIVIISSFLMITYASESLILNEDWQAFKITYGKTHRSQMEEQFRMKIFMENKKKIENHNRDYAYGKVSFRLKMNNFGDLTSNEFKAMMKGFKMSKNSPRNYEISMPANGTLPITVDWRKKGAITGVKDQGSCQSGWAFSATGSLEGQIFLKTGKLVPLSEQNLIDCSISSGNKGCNGGNVEFAFKYIIDNKGLDTEASYPYESSFNVCRFKQKTVAGYVKSYENIQRGSEVDLQNAVANIGPISVAIDASHDSFRFYSKGIYNEPDCTSDWVDHSVLVVGYGTDNEQDYWLVKNSWGTYWGEDGYIRMARNKSNQCAIATAASYPIV